MRRPLIAGNWKMHKTVAQARALAADVVVAVAGLKGVEVLLAPAATALAAVAVIARPQGLSVAAQTMHWADQGAYTGEVSPLMVAELADYVILGHSERRSLFGETDEALGRKVHAAFAHGLRPILCVGERLDEREAGQADAVVLGQLAALDGIAAQEAAGLVLAYEPVWAIGSGRACDAAEAARVMGVLRTALGARFGAEAAASARLLYGGSVNPENIAAYLAAADIDGALVGGASLEAEPFAALVRAAADQGAPAHEAFS
ncbi:MAG TPA: triose-phosphate isomerase [Anaerolineae bacterium]|nr:triose-phosphate isomerase [Ardenticatenia bacterium]HQZ69744.1 triose-phosphate isomerase [Anaerolineae bacterium]HRA18950.1 triose-phosphate isomerase [Anaerolineae bacterium]